MFGDRNNWADALPSGFVPIGVSLQRSCASLMRLAVSGEQVNKNGAVACPAWRFPSPAPHFQLSRQQAEM